MRRHLRSLTQLRAFEAAGRHGSLTRAAQELSVTQGAISRQVRELEREVGQRLFRRTAHGIVLTPSGRRLMPSLTDALDRMDQAMGQLVGRREAEVLTVSLSPTLAMKWLIPRLPRFHEANPGIEVHVSTGNASPSDERANDLPDELDLGIRCLKGPVPGFHAEWFLADDHSPVISNALLASGPPLKEPKDILAYPLLQSNSIGEAYAEWFEIAGVPGPPTSGPRYDHVQFALEACAAGLGIALTATACAEPEIASGVLVRPFPEITTRSWGHYIVGKPRRLAEPKVAAFVRWLHDEASASPGNRRPTPRP